MQLVPWHDRKLWEAAGWRIVGYRSDATLEMEYGWRFYLRAARNRVRNGWSLWRFHHAQWLFYRYWVK